MKPEDFDRFFTALHGVEPFPWQSALAQEVIRTGRWRSLIDLPTSAGKTAVMDIALFHLASEAGKPVKKRTAPRRIFFVVDRRLVVDEAANRARSIAERLEMALSDSTNPLYEIASRLEKLGSTGRPLEVLRLRGGIPKEPNPFRHPLQAMVVLSTVDQIGSRLLFRGYGVSEYGRPIHAGMVGMDSLIFLDEAHLSQPFLQTLEWVHRYRGSQWAESPIETPFQVVSLTATPSSSSKAFTLTKRDRDPKKAKKLVDRLKAKKPATLVEIKGATGENKAEDEARKQLENALFSQARELMAKILAATDNSEGLYGKPVIGIVANRVATARGVFDKLSTEDTDAILLTGRNRPYDRDRLIEQHLPRFRAGRDASANPKPLFVVATQTVEVGADLDFDVLVTEAASLDALKQRFGRLNRLGRRASAFAVIVFHKTLHSRKDPIYGDAIEKTWKNWLNNSKVAQDPKREPKVVDFGLNAKVQKPPTKIFKDLLAPHRNAPVLMPAHVDLLAQTSPSPHIEPDVAALLHGIGNEVADVSIVWRGDLPQRFVDDDAEWISGMVALVPPREAEALQLPIWLVKTWLADRVKDDLLSDTESGKPEESDVKSNRLVLVWRGPEESRLVKAADVRPGDTIVIPSAWGGLDTYGWNPSYLKPVSDIADVVARHATGKPVIRVHPALVDSWFENGKEESVSTARSALRRTLTTEGESETGNELVQKFLDDVLTLDGLRSEIRQLLSLGASAKVTLYPPRESQFPEGFVLAGKKNIPLDFTDEDDRSSQTVEIGLESHCLGVGNFADRFAQGAGLPQKMAKDVALAAQLHDLGKADLRFQSWLRGGRRLSPREQNELLAKSSLPATDWQASQRARRAARYPKGARHECYSVAMIEKSAKLLEQAHDRELVIYLVGTHHGRGRPFLPTINDPGMPLVRFSFAGKSVEFQGQHGLEGIGAGWTERFWHLIRRYGYWGLAYMETLLRLADHRRSEQEMGK